MSCSKGLIDGLVQPKKVVVGVDFGTSGTGFAFMFVADKTATVHNYTDWDDCDTKYCKNLSAILFDSSDDIAENWGYSAEKEYSIQSDFGVDESSSSVGTSSSTDPTKGKALFKYFKKDFKIDMNGSLEQNGFQKKVKDIIVEYLRFVRDLIMQRISLHVPSIAPSDIRWCFSVPVVWEEEQKYEFRKLIAQAQFIENENCSLHDFLLVTEPEAAAIYCIEKDGRKSLQPDKIIMILDAGGGTVDLTVHKLDNNLKLKTVTIPTGNMFGSTALDDEFIAILNENCSKGMLDMVKRENPYLYFEFLQNWEKAKRKATDIKKPLKVDVPPKLAKRIRQSSTLIDDMGKLKLSASHVERIFKKPLENIVSQVKQQLKETKRNTRKPVDYLFLVGGFGQSEILRKKLEEECTGTTLVMPRFSGEAVVHGATLLGMDPALILTRRSKYTYGIEVEQVFQSSLHDDKRCVCRGGEFVVPGVFKSYAKRNEEIETERVTSHIFTIPAGQTETDINIFFSPKESVKYVDEDNVGLLKQLHITVTPKTTDQTITVLMKFGEAQVLVEVVQEDGTTANCELTNVFQSLKL